MAGMVRDSRQPFDQFRHPRQGPQRRREPVGLGARAQRAFDLPQLHPSQLWLAPSAPRGFQARPALGAPGLMPVIYGSGCHAQLSRDRRLLLTITKKRGIYDRLVSSGLPRVAN